jgi:hypothetical protein
MAPPIRSRPNLTLATSDHATLAMINVQRIGNDEPARLKPIAGPFAAKVSLAQGEAGVD